MHLDRPNISFLYAALICHRYLRGRDSGAQGRGQVLRCRGQIGRCQGQNPLGTRDLGTINKDKPIQGQGALAKRVPSPYSIHELTD